MSEELVSRTSKDRFYIRAKIVKKKLSYRDHQSWGKEWNNTAEVVLLVPEQSTECDCFYHAWLPEKLSEQEKAQLFGQKEWSEIVFEAGSPIFGYFRAALKYPDHLYDRPYLFVMTKMAEEKLLSYEGQKINLTSIGEEEEEKIYGDLKLETRSPYADLE